MRPFESLEDQPRQPVAEAIENGRDDIKVGAKEDSPALYPYDDSEQGEEENVVQDTAQRAPLPEHCLDRGEDQDDEQNSDKQRNIWLYDLPHRSRE